MKVLAIGLAVVLLCAAIAVALRSASFALASLRPHHHSISAKDAQAARDAIPDLRDVTLTTSDGLHLRAWFSPGRRRAAIVLIHGGGGDRLQLFPEATILSRHGYGFLVYDSRASGESEGDATSWGDRERRDATAALDFVSARPEIDPSRVGILGFSIGATTACLTAADDPRARAVILYATWTSLRDEIKDKFGSKGPLSFWPALFAIRQAGVDVDALRPIDRVHDIAPRPIFFITGTDDTDTPVPIMPKMFAAAGEPKRLWIVPGARHGTYVETAPAEYEARVIGFLDEVFFP